MVLPDLRVEVPQLEPSTVLLEQLSQLSRLSQLDIASSGRGGGTQRALMAAASVTVLAGASWLTGTMPGVASPFSHGHGGGHGHAQHAPADPGAASDQRPADESAVPYLAGSVPPGLAKPHQHGQHPGQATPHGNNGNHTGQTKPHHNNGNHTGQTTPHLNDGNHTGQTKPHQDAQPVQPHGQATELGGQDSGQDSSQDSGQGNGRRT